MYLSLSMKLHDVYMKYYHINQDAIHIYLRLNLYTLILTFTLFMMCWYLYRVRPVHCNTKCHGDDTCHDEQNTN